MKVFFVFCSVTLGSGGRNTMESACQVKGCKVNKKANKNVVHDDPRAHTKENNNVNCSDDENNEETSKKNTKKNAKGGNATANGTTTTVSNHHSSSNNNNSTNVSNKNSNGSNHHHHVTDHKVVSHDKPVTNGLTYNKVVSNDKPITNGLTYNKVVSNYKTATSDLAYNKVVSSNKVTPNYSSIISNKVNSNESYSDKVANKVISTNGIISSAISNSIIPKESTNDATTTTTNNGVVSNNESTKTTTTTTSMTITPKPKLDSEAQQRRAVLSYEQVCRLNDVMNEVVSIHGRGNFPTLEVRLRDLVNVVKCKLEADPSIGGAGMRVRDIRLNGGAASHVLATESQPYNDLDLIFGVELSSGRNYDKVKAAVLGSLFDLLPEGVSRKRITTCSLKEAYVSKMVKVNNDGDRWSLISLGNSRGHRNVELKFVDTMRRQFEFSVDSFQIVLDSLLLFPESSKVEFTENYYPTVVGESVYGDFHEALYHLQKKLISTRHPEEIRGGGLLKYCNLLVKQYKAAQPDYIKTLERYMCSRFFIDFPDIGQQKAKLENYLWNHFVGAEEEALKYQYLTLLHSVVEESTVCLMGHERRQTLALIESLAYQVLCQEQQRLTNHQAPPPAYVYANGYYYAPVIPTACYTCTCNSWMACSS